MISEWGIEAAAILSDKGKLTTNWPTGKCSARSNNNFKWIGNFSIMM